MNVPGGIPAWLGEDMERVEGVLMSTASSSTSRLVGDAATHLIKAGGKRVRPALVLLSSRIGEPGRTTSDLAAAAIELVHLATLYHDDVIDQTETRRGTETVHSRWGVEVAVLSGDFLFACGCGLGAEAGGEVPRILARAIAEVCEGQIVETSIVGDPNRDIDEYFRTIGAKTAALFRAACELGASTSGAVENERRAVMSYGENLGLAFQIVDDLLDVVGDPDVTGKVPGTDIKEGVFTLPVILAADKEPELREVLASPERDLSVVLPVLERTGALDQAHAEATDRARSAREALSKLPESPHRDAMSTLIDQVLTQL